MIMEALENGDIDNLGELFGELNENNYKAYTVALYYQDEIRKRDIEYAQESRIYGIKN